MGILAGTKQSTGSGSTGSTTGNRIYFEYTTGFYYTVGTTDRGVAGGTDAFVAKYDQSGNLQWQRTIGGSGTETANGVYADTSGNVYFVGTTTSSGQGGSDVLIVKYDASGNLSWQRTWGGTGTDIGIGIYADASYVLITGSTTSTTGFGGGATSDAFLLYYNVSGTLQWQRVIYSSYEDIGNGVTFDASFTRFVVCGTTRAVTSGANSNGFVASIDTVGTQQWQNNYYQAGYSDGDSLNNIMYNKQDGSLYFTGTALGPTNYAWLGKIYGNNTFQFGVGLYGGANFNMRGLGVSNGRTTSDIYFTGTNGNNYFIAKFNTSAALQWQNTISGFTVKDLSVDYNPSALGSRDFIFVSGTKTTTSSIDATTIKLASGSGNFGTYTNYTYSSGGLSYTTGVSPTNQGTWLSVGTPTLTSATSTLTSSTSTLTVNITSAGSYYSTLLGGTPGGSSLATLGQYTVHTFANSGTFVPSSTGFIDVLAVGAGGDCGAPGPGPSGGGGAGAVVYRKFVGVTSGTFYPVSIGSTTINGSGGNTIFNASGVGVASVTAFGGGSGGPGTFAGPAGNSPNASGGGASPAPSTAGIGFGASTFGYPGGTASPTHSGGGGGAGSIGGNSPGSAPGLGGSGVPVAYFTGISTDIVSAGGGPGVTPANYGNGGQSSTPGTSKGGALYIRYI